MWWDGKQGWLLKRMKWWGRDDGWKGERWRVNGCAKVLCSIRQCQELF